MSLMLCVRGSCRLHSKELGIISLNAGNGENDVPNEGEQTPYSEDVQTLALQATKGDEEAFSRLKERAPEFFSILQTDWFPLVRKAEETLIKAFFPSQDEGGRLDLLAVESIKHHADELRQALYAVHQTPLEKLLVDRLVCCWIAVYHADLAAATRMPRDKEVQRWVDRCHRRFSSASRDLATVHKLLGPKNIQINLAEHQQIANVFPKNDG